LLNDLMQSLIPSVYPILKDNYALDFGQIGMITLAFMFTSSLLQPLVGAYTDKHPMPFSLALGMGFTFAGLILLSVAHHYLGHSHGCRAGRHRLGGVSSGIVAHRAHGVRRPLWVSRSRCFRSAAISDRHRPRACGADHRAVRAGQHRLVLSGRALAIVVLWRIGQWYAPRVAQRKAGHTSLPADGPVSRAP
jgi:FSR family fosmidomycin resistance protein-like MFS transporter